MGWPKHSLNMLLVWQKLFGGIHVILDRLLTIMAPDFFPGLDWVKVDKTTDGVFRMSERRKQAIVGLFLWAGIRMCHCSVDSFHIKTCKIWKFRDEMTYWNEHNDSWEVNWSLQQSSGLYCHLRTQWRLNHVRDWPLPTGCWDSLRQPQENWLGMSAQKTDGRCLDWKCPNIDSPAGLKSEGTEVKSNRIFSELFTLCRY